MNINYIKQIREILGAGGFSQNELAKRLGVTFAALNRWIHGHAKPHPRRIEAIQKLYRDLIGYPAVTEKQLTQIVRKAEVFKRRGMWEFIRKHQELQDELLLEHTYNSTSIEGTTFNKRETEAVIFAKRIIPDKSLIEHLEVTNHAAVLRRIFQKEYQGAVTEEFIKRLHKDLMQGIREDAGSYSKYQRAIRGVNMALTHPEDIPEEMANLIKEWQRPPVKKTIKEIASFHIHFELIHPFGDGNGRVGRLLMTLQCLQSDYAPVVVENERKTEYYEALEYGQRKSEAPFVNFLVEEMERTDKIIKKYRW